MDDIDDVTLPRMVSRGVPSRSDGEEEVDSFGSPFRTGSPPSSERSTPPGLHYVLWMPPGDIERVGCIAYVFLNEDTPTFSPAPFIRSTVFSMAS
jgi:hypothetical protein